MLEFEAPLVSAAVFGTAVDAKEVAADGNMVDRNVDDEDDPGCTLAVDDPITTDAGHVNEATSVIDDEE